MRSFYRLGTFPSDLKKTYIVLIPQKANSTTPQDFRPISLCNVIYKIIAKSLADRMKTHLPSRIHASQAAFIPGRHIASNIIIAQEIAHTFNLKS